jgi:hypothetical protein
MKTGIYHREINRLALWRLKNEQMKQGDLIQPEHPTYYESLPEWK